MGAQAAADALHLGQIAAQLTLQEAGALGALNTDDALLGKGHDTGAVAAVGRACLRLSLLIKVISKRFQFLLPDRVHVVPPCGCDRRC